MKSINKFFILQMIFFSKFYKVLSVNINSIRIESDEFDVMTDGQIVIKADKQFEMRLFTDVPLDPRSEISFTNVKSAVDGNCDDLRRSEIFGIKSVAHKSATVSVQLSKGEAALGDLMLCLRTTTNSSDNFSKSNWVHQGNEPYMMISVIVDGNRTKYILIWVFSFLIPFFILLSALFSGLAMSLLTLTRSELKVLRSQGNVEEKKYSKAVAPLRKRGNLLFCTLLLMNTLTNVVVAVLFHELISYYSILAATLLIVFLGEILPQTICSRFGLSYGNKMAWLTNIFVVLAFPFSFPVSKLMDAILDDEIPTVYNRDHFQEILTNSQQPSEKVKKEDDNDLKALKLSNKTVGDIMVRLEDAFMEEYNNVLTVEKVTEIIKKGYTRIPVFETQRSNIVALLHLKDLTLIDPMDKLTIKTVCKFYNRPVNFVFEDTKLTVMLEEFKKGQSHMAFVQRVNSDGPGDPYYETLGMVTLEDVIEDIFHSDANSHKPANNVFDPNIHFSNNELTTRMEKMKFNQFAVFQSESQQASRSGDGNDVRTSLTPNMFKALKSFLTTLSPFKPELISPVVLEKLLKQSAICKVKRTEPSSNVPSANDRNPSPMPVAMLEKCKPMDGMVVVLEGKVEVEIGAEKFVFVEGPFACFGLPVLLNAISATGSSLQSTPFPGSTPTTANENIENEVGQSQYIPDFTVRPMTEEVTYIKIPRNTYISSIQASLLKCMHERGLEIMDNSEQMSRESSFVMANNARNSTINDQFTFQRPLEILSRVGNKPSNYIIENYAYDGRQPQPPSLSPPTFTYRQLDESPKLGVWTPYQPQEDANHSWDVSHTSQEKLDTPYKDKVDSGNEKESNIMLDNKDGNEDVGDIDVVVVVPGGGGDDKDDDGIINDERTNKF